ncbi:DNA-MISMATCH-REPAIR-2 domain-containing protein [Aphelenchoides bicaudatus]|nr:DNA-MISMATCH-REPAIR-2 domain-containing protein [Aphelenchoides bicaudatus]
MDIEVKMEIDAQIEYLQINESALTALEIFDSSAENAPKSSSVYSLFGLLNKTRTTAGKNLLGSWLKQPLCDLKLIAQRQDVVDALNEANNCRDELHKNLLRKVHDVGSLARKLTRGKSKLEDCYKIYRSICTLQAIIEQLADVEECVAVQELILTPLKQSARELSKMRALIESTVIYDESTQRYYIKPDVDEDLVELNQQIEDLKSKAENIASLLRSETGEEHIKLESNSENGFYFKVTLKAEKNVRDANVIVLTCTKGAGLTFTTSKLKDLNDDFRDLNTQYAEGQKEVEANVIETCCSFAEACESLAQRIAVLDVLVSFSVFCCNSSNLFVRPELHEKGTNVFELRECRHPIIENIPFAPQFIPNDICFENGRRFITLTGPNMGGKSTYLKSAALTVLLGQIGCFVPCGSAQFSLIDGIYCRIGAGDEQGKGISTFMHEMKDVATILSDATCNSLVIIDELGRGTSTFDGFGIVYAVSEEIVCKLKSLTILATHFHEMAQLKLSYPELVQNQKVDTFLDSNGAVTILYKISEGISDKSFGISIARQVGFSEKIIEHAERILNGLERSSVNGKELNARRLINSCQQMNVEEIRFMLQSLP